MKWGSWGSSWVSLPALPGFPGSWGSSWVASLRKGLQNPVQYSSCRLKSWDLVLRRPRSAQSRRSAVGAVAFHIGWALVSQGRRPGALSPAAARPTGAVSAPRVGSRPHQRRPTLNPTSAPARALLADRSASGSPNLGARPTPHQRLKPAPTAVTPPTSDLISLTFHLSPRSRPTVIGFTFHRDGC
jgi:hypothetical protein